MNTVNQQIAIDHNEKNILVSASAGSGKTRVMIERAIRLVTEKKAKIKDLLLVTFTESAAREMKEKLKNAFVKEINGGKDYLLEELNDIETCDVSTIHSFCAKTIRKYFYRAEVSPDFSVLDENNANMLKNQAINQTFKNFYEENDRDFLSLSQKFKQKRHDEEFKQKIIDCHEFLQIDAHPERYKQVLQSLYSDADFDKLLAEYKRYVDGKLQRYLDILNDAKRVFTVNGVSVFIEQIDIVSDKIKDFLESEDIYHVKSMDLNLPGTSNIRLKTDELKIAKEQFVFVKNGFNEIFENLSENITDYNFDKEKNKKIFADTISLYKIIDRYESVYNQLKAEENAVDFNDLEHLTLKILDDVEILADLKNKYKYIFIDEYQDTNSVQEEIITKISCDNLFMVGDEKQSIYGFRGCRPEIFEQKFKKMQKEQGATVLLNENFRSAENVVDFVNEIFDFSMTEDVYGRDYSSSRLVYGKLYDGHKGRAQIHYFNTSSKGEKPKRQIEPKVYDVKEYFDVPDDEEFDESCMIAEIIKNELKNDIYDLTTNRIRNVTYGDIVLLSRTNNGGDISPIVKGLRSQGIPVSSAISENVCNYPEVILLINALKLIDCFLQDIPLVSVMKSPIGNFSEEELARIVSYYIENSNEKGCFYKAVLFYANSRAVADGLKDKLNAFINYYDKIRFLADFIGAKEILKVLIEDSDYENILLAQVDSRNASIGENKIKRIRKFLTVAETFGEKLTVSEFLKKIDTCKNGFELTIEGQENSVSVMTIHKSKGLEFPIVIVCGLERKKKAEDYSKAIVKDYNYGLLLSYYNEESKTIEESVIRSFCLAKKADNNLKEDLRLFYVALTRAKYSLHLAFKGSKDTRKDCFLGAKCMLDFVPKKLSATTYDKSVFESNKIKSPTRKILIGKCDEKLKLQVKNQCEFNYPYRADTKLLLKATVTELNHLQTAKEKEIFSAVSSCDKTTANYDVLDIVDEEGGTTAHKILEHIDFKRLDDFDGQVRSIIESGIVEESEVNRINLEKIKKALSCKEILSIGDKKTFKEHQFILSVNADTVLDTESTEKVLIQGIIDLLIIDGDKAEIVDYKYSKSSAGALKKRYSKQLDIYQKAVENILHKKVIKKVLLNIYSGEIIYID